MEKRELKNKMLEKNIITMSNGDYWFLDNPFGIDYPCYIKGSYGVMDFENLKGNYEIISYMFGGKGRKWKG